MDTIDEEESTSLAPDEAFSMLGNETRLGILHTLAEAESPLSFSELYDRIDYDPSTNFSYHLQQLDGHFVHQTDEGYELGQAGIRVVHAILSGTVTEAPRLERTGIDHRCEFCGAPTEISYTDGILGLYCTECSSAATESWPAEFQGYIRGMPFPPAGLQGRTADEVYRAAAVRGYLQGVSIVNDICPVCSAPFERSFDVCNDHQHEADFCEACDRRWPVLIFNRCTNCTIEGGIRLRTYVLTSTEVLAFLTTHGINPLAPSTEPWTELDVYDETVGSTEPFEARVTISIDGEAISVSVDDELSVFDVTRRSDA
jgi:DNA-binding transcriptional ArsR family regulator